MTELVRSSTDGLAGVSLLPVSPMQQRLWLVEQRSPDRSVFAVPMLLHVTGRLRADLLRACLARWVARHEALRTCLSILDGELHQVVFDADDVTIPLRELDLSDDSAVHQHVLADAALPFDFASAPLAKACLITVDDAEQYLCLTVHHAVCDGTSMDILLDELHADYAVLAAGAATADTDNAGTENADIEFGDWVEWQQERRDSDEAREHLDYWVGQLTGAPALLELPTDRERPRGGVTEGAGHRFRIEPDLTGQLRAVARERDASLFVVLLAALVAVCHRYSGQRDICVGTPVSGRTTPELERIVGLLLNTVVVRVRFAADTSFGELVDNVRAAVAGAVAHQDTPFEDVLDAVSPPRHPGSTPLFQVLFTMEQNRHRRWDVPGAHVRTVPAPHGAARNELAIAITADGDALDVDIEYRPDLFDADRIARFAEHCQILLAGVAADRSLCTLPLLTADERTLLVAWNETRRPFPRTASSADLFAEQVRRAPDAVAVYSAEGAMTYAELDAAAESLARRLRGVGVGPETVVGVCLPRSRDLVVALLAVFKAGGAYLALDPALPRDRLAFVLRDARSPALVTLPRFADLAAAAGVRPLQVAGGDEPAAADLPRVTGEHLAYVLYTSGSTGRPKGVAVSHRALARLVKNPDYCELGPEHVHLQLSPVSFDASLIELWGPLLNGGAVAVPAGEFFLDQLREGLTRFPVTTMLLISPQLPLLLDEPRHLLDGVRQVLVGGDVLSPKHARLMVEAFPDVPLHHVYGPTECTLFATARTLRRVDDTRPTVPIGGPITNTRAYVLDPRLGQQPIGVPGELYLAGDGVARGYLHQPGLTSECFVADPYGPPGTRMYRTGDLARWQSTGDLEFLGRIDGQVKIRGFRIELGEIETVLAAHPDVAEAVAVVRDELPGGRGIVGYVVLARPGTVAGATLREYLRGTLPDYMVPVAILELAAMPLTPNGKLDRVALPDVRPSPAGPIAEPLGSPTAVAVGECWREVLEMPQVGAQDGFFDIGGNSLHLLRLHRRMERMWPGLLSIAELFELSTVAAQAAAIDERSGRTGGASAPPSFEL